MPDGAPVNLALVKLPPDALMFPNPPMSGEGFSFTALRNPRNTTKEFIRKATGLGFPGLRLHDLRGSHETHLLDNGVSPEAVAERCGHDVAVMLRSYAKRSRKEDAKAAAVIEELSKNALLWNGWRTKSLANASNGSSDLSKLCPSGPIVHFCSARKATK